MGGLHGLRLRLAVGVRPRRQLIRLGAGGGLSVRVRLCMRLRRANHRLQVVTVGCQTGHRCMSEMAVVWHDILRPTSRLSQD